MAAAAQNNIADIKYGISLFAQFASNTCSLLIPAFSKLRHFPLSQTASKVNLVVNLGINFCLGVVNTDLRHSLIEEQYPPSHESHERKKKIYFFVNITELLSTGAITCLALNDNLNNDQASTIFLVSWLGKSLIELF